MKVVHIVAGLAEWNGMANTARQFMAQEQEDGNASLVTNNLAALSPDVDVVYVHGAWLPVLWRAAKRARKIGARLLVRPAGSYDPVRLAFHGWKKRLVAFFEHRMLRQADVVVATCEAEKEWIRAYEPRVKKIEIVDLKRFFDLSHAERIERADGKLHLLYLGRRHPLKGLEFLEEAVKSLEFGVQSSVSNAWSGNSQPTAHNAQLELKVVSNAFGEEKEKVWKWCDVLVLPTLSENFGRVIAEALERGKRVITTDGAPAWSGDCLESRVSGSELGGEIWTGYGGRLMYLKGYRDGTREKRVQLLKTAIELMSRA